MFGWIGRPHFFAPQVYTILANPQPAALLCEYPNEAAPASPVTIASHLKIERGPE